MGAQGEGIIAASYAGASYPVSNVFLLDNDVGRGSHNILTVRKAFEEALHTLSIVFRYGYSPAGIGNWLQPNGDDGNFVWQKTSTPRMTDSMLSQIVTISPRLLQYRNWLRGFVLRDSVPSSPLPLANGDQMMANLHGVS